MILLITFSARKEEKATEEPEAVSPPSDTKKEFVKGKVAVTKNGAETSKIYPEVTKEATEVIQNTTEEPQKTAVVAQKSVEVTHRTVELTKKSVELTKKSVEVTKKTVELTKKSVEVTKDTAVPQVPPIERKELKLSKPSANKEEKGEPVIEKKRPTTLVTPSQKKVSEEVVSRPKAKVESSSSSSESTLRQSSFAVLTSTTTTSEAETLKQVQTPESETVDTGLHYKKIQAVEPLVQINKPRLLEEVIPHVLKPPPELVPGSAINKVLSVEKRGDSGTVLTDFQVGVGVEVNVEVGTEMSRRYTSSAG